jgi:hypothetical protein
MRRGGEHHADVGGRALQPGIEGGVARFHLARRPAFVARQLLGRGQGTRVGADLHRLAGRAAADRQRDGLLAAAADLQAVTQRIRGNRIGCGVAVHHGLAHQFVGAEVSLRDAVALDALETRAAGVQAPLRAHVDDVFEVGTEADHQLDGHGAQREIAHLDHLVADPGPDEPRARDVQRAARQHDAAALAAHVRVGQVHAEQHVVFARAGRQQQRPQPGHGQREAREMPHAGAVQAGLGARFGVDVADFIEQAEAVIVPQRVRALRARHVGGDYLVRRVQRHGPFRGHRPVTSCS